MTSIIQGLNVSKCIYTFQYSLYKYFLYVRRHVPFYEWWLSWQRLHSLNDSLQTTLYCHIDTWFVTCSLWICHYELLYIYGINDVWILNLESWKFHGAGIYLGINFVFNSPLPKCRLSALIMLTDDAEWFILYNFRIKLLALGQVMTNSLKPSDAYMRR